MASNNSFHNFPTIIDGYAGAPTTMTGGDGKTYYKYVVDGYINGHRGSYVWIVDSNGMCNHRCFEEW